MQTGSVWMGLGVLLERGAPAGGGNDQPRKSELTEREPDPNKRTHQRNAEGGRQGKEKGKQGRKGETDGRGCCYRQR